MLEILNLEYRKKKKLIEKISNINLSRRYSKEILDFETKTLKQKKIVLQIY